MGASTIDIISTKWEEESKILKDLKECSEKIQSVFYYNEDEVQIHKNYADEKLVLILEVETEESLEWYYNEYPEAKFEPEERIPYFVFNKEINGSDKLFTIVTSDSTSDDRIIYEFFKEYLSINKNQYLLVNKTIWLDYDKIRLYCDNNYS